MSRSGDLSPLGKSSFFEKKSEEDDDLDEDLSGPVGNPAPPPDVDLDKLRGDRIGDTVYSGKWCIRTVMKLMQSNVAVPADETVESTEGKPEEVDMDEELQNEVGALWDMTSNVEVCQYLQSVGAIESICCVISKSRCSRATEMCAGMLANIVYHDQLWQVMKDDPSLFTLIINLLTSTDQPALLEICRFFNTGLCHTDHSCIYSTLSENGQLVTQELLRILSGSTNVDLLNQAAEFVQHLVYLDDNESHFCTLFAESSFVSAVVEASRELGYSHDSPGQIHLMDVFHCFTTYEAGVLAIESNLAQIAEACSASLKHICQSLNLSGSCTTITTVIATLNHLLCRNDVVRMALLSSPSFLHCVLKTLVALYRKLGCYKDLAYSGSFTSETIANKHTSHLARRAGGVEETPPARAGQEAEAASWSERAQASLDQATPRKIPTPDASPVQVQRAKDLEVSWSERRFSSPIIDDEFSDNNPNAWKRPIGRRVKKLKKKKEGGPVSENEISCTTQDDKLDSDGIRAQAEDNAGENDTVSSTSDIDKPGHRNIHTHKESEQSSVDNVDKEAVKIRLQDRFLKEGRESGGFSPTKGLEEMDVGQSGGNMGEEEMKIRTEVICKADSSDSAHCTQTAAGQNADMMMASQAEDKGACSEEAVKVEVDPITQASFLMKGDGNGPKDKSHIRGQRGSCGDPMSEKQSRDVHDEDADDVLKSDFTKNGVGFEEVVDEDFDDLAASSDCVTGDKYHILLSAIKEILTDYFNYFVQVPHSRDNGEQPCISKTMKYLNNHCSRVELRAIVKCVGPEVEEGKPLGSLLQACQSFKATHVSAVITQCL